MLADRSSARSEAVLVEVPLAVLCLRLARDAERRFLAPLLQQGNGAVPAARREGEGAGGATAADTPGFAVPGSGLRLPPA
jgi:hypothetical protein